MFYLKIILLFESFLSSNIIKITVSQDLKDDGEKGNNIDDLTVILLDKRFSKIRNFFMKHIQRKKKLADFEWLLEFCSSEEFCSHQTTVKVFFGRLISLSDVVLQK